VDQDVVDSVIAQLNEEFGRETPLTESDRPVLDYLGIKFDHSVPGEVTVDMIEYVKAVIADMPDEMKGKAAAPAASHLFTIRENPVPLSAEKPDIYRRIVMQLQYLTQRA
jgi:hypothetical protein